MALKILAFFAGVLLIAAMTHGAVLHAGGYLQPAAVPLLALAIGLIAGSCAIGTAWGHRRFSLALAIGLAMLCGEAVAAFRTLETTLAARSELGEPERQHLAKYATAVEEKSRTLKAVEAAALAIRDGATSKACLENCRKLLEGAKATADADYAKAVSAVALIGRPRTVLSVAGVLGLDPVKIDLAAAAATSFGINGLAAALLAFAVHGGGISNRRNYERSPVVINQMQLVDIHAETVSNEAAAEHAGIDDDRQTNQRASTRADVRPAPDSSIVKPMPIEQMHATPLEHVDEFAHQTVHPSRSGSVPLGRIHASYLTWCHVRSIEPISPGDFAETFGLLCRNAGLEVVLGRSGPTLKGVKLALPALAKPHAA